MNRIQEVFGKTRVFLPVIHTLSTDQIRRNAEIAKVGGADGVLLISHVPMFREPELLRAALELRALYPDWWVGVNVLGSHSDTTMLTTIRHGLIQGLWSDDVGLSPANSLEDARELGALIRESRGDWSGLYMAGAAFKYQTWVPPTRWGKAAHLAAAAGADVVVTSGDATGEPAPPEKLEKMREALGDHALGLASGVTADNVTLYPAVNAFLVASSILQDGPGEQFDPKALKELADLIHQMQ